MMFAQQVMDMSLGMMCTAGDTEWPPASDSV